MRNYGRILTAIWRDPDFIVLPASAQRTYIMVITQPDITAAGTLPLTVGRWAQLAPDTTRESIEADLALLESRRFVIVDRSTEELLVRSFVKHDHGYGNPKRLPSILQAAKAILSRILRRVLRREMQSLGVDTSLLGEAPPAEHVSAGECLSDTPRVVVEVIGTVTTVEETSTGGRQLARESYSPPRTRIPASTRAIEEPPPDLESAEPTPTEVVVGEWLASLQQPPPPQVVRAVGVIVNGALKNGLPIDGVRAGVAAWQGKRYGPGALAGFIHEHTAQPRAGSEMAIFAAGPPRQRSTRDERVDGWLALGKVAAA